MGAQLITILNYNRIVASFVITLPGLKEYWEHLVEANDCLASSRLRLRRRKP